MNLPSLLEEAKDGKLSPADARAVAELLREQPDSRDAYTAIHILGRGFATDYRDLVETFLDSPDDPDLARIALTTLVNYWDLGGEYRDKLREFVAGIEWDFGNDVRLVALSAAGELARKTGDHELVADLLEIADDPREDVLVRDTAFDAIARAVGTEYNDLRRRSRLAQDDPWATEVLDRARALAGG
jgi:hypothetical protein